MNPSTDAPLSTRIKVGIFGVLGLVLIGAMTIYVNHKPQWWRPCQLVHISIEDGTGLKMKSPIRSLGIEIGYLKTVDLAETKVDLGICITAPVEVLPETRAYIKGEGFLGDKFVELKPVKYVGPREIEPEAKHSSSRRVNRIPWAVRLLAEGAPTAQAAPPSGKGGKEIPVGEQGQDIQHLVNRVDELVNEMTHLTTNLKAAINPEDLKATMKQLNVTLENASRTLSPESGLNQTAQRTLAKLEDAIEQLRDMMTRVNKGEGSVGMLLNDPTYADELRMAIKNVNKLLAKVSTVRFYVDMGGEQIPAYNGTRGYLRLKIYATPDYYYHLGITIDPRGKITNLSTTTTSGGVTNTTTTSQVESTGILLTGMLGKVLWNRIDLALGALNGDGCLSTGFLLGPYGKEEMIQVRGDTYSRGSSYGIDERITAVYKPFEGSTKPWQALYAKFGLEGFNTAGTGGVLPFMFGGGIAFDDENIRLLFTLR